MLKIFSKILLILLSVILVVNLFAKSIYGVVENDKIYVQKEGKIEEHLKYYSKQYKEYRYLKCNVWESNSNVIYTMEEDPKKKYGYYVEKGDILNDDRIWRIIKNGYPYKDEKELGLNSKYNAYAVTKWAIACILEKMDLNLFKAEDNDVVSKEMLRVLKQLVYIGKNDIEKSSDTLFSIVEGKTIGIDIRNYIVEIKQNRLLDEKNLDRDILNNTGCELKYENEINEGSLEKEEDEIIGNNGKQEDTNEIIKANKKREEKSKLQSKDKAEIQNVKTNIEENKLEPKVYIENNGLDEMNIGQDVENNISIRNIGNTGLERLVWKYKVPIKYVKLKKFYTGTYNQNIIYNLFCKTNVSDDYRLIMEGVPSNENFEIDFEQELSNDEYVTEIKIEFESVDDRFCSNENPHLISNVLQDIKSESKFVSVASIKGILKSYEVTDESKCETIVCKILPKTGF